VEAGGEDCNGNQVSNREKDKRKMKQNMQDLTEGSLGKKILIFSVPLMLSNLLQVLFNMADIAVIGQFAGSLSLGAVGSTATLVTMFTGFLIGLSGGINVLTALYYGAKDKDSLSKTIHSAALVSLIMGVLLLVLGVGLSEWMLTALKTKEELLDKAVLYLRIYYLGMPALAIYNFGNAVYSAVGNTKKPLYYLGFSGVLNIILNLFFVIVCHMDVAGVALASIISQYVSAVLILQALLRSKDIYALHPGKLRMDRELTRDILKLGMPSGLQNVIFQFANSFVQMGVNSFDATMVAGNSAATNADAMVYDVMAAFYTACGSFMGQNYGAGKKKRVRNSYLISLAYSFGIGLILGVSLVIFGRSFLSLFTRDAAVMDAGMYRLTIMGFSYCISAFMDCTIAAARAMGKSIAPMFIVIMGSCVFRVIWVYTVFAYFHTIPSLYLLYVFSWSITAVAEILYFIRIYKQKMGPLLLRRKSNLCCFAWVRLAAHVALYIMRLRFRRKQKLQGSVPEADERVPVPHRGWGSESAG